jgi:hypothetical protein
LGFKGDEAPEKLAVFREIGKFLKKFEKLVEVRDNFGYNTYKLIESGRSRSPLNRPKQFAVVESVSARRTFASRRLFFLSARLY